MHLDGPRENGRPVPPGDPADAGGSSNCDNFVPLVETLGVLSQIRDDYQNLRSDTCSGNKGVYEDASKGKFSYPIVHNIGARPGDLRLLNIRKKRSEDAAVNQFAVDGTKTTGSFEYREDRMVSLLRQASEQISAEWFLTRDDVRFIGDQAVRAVAKYIKIDGSNISSVL